MQTQTDGQDVQTCSDTMPSEIFNLASQTYTGNYDTEGANRIAPVPSQVASVIGGDSSGGAQVKTPKVWSDVYLQYVFNPSLERPDYTPTYQLANSTVNDPGNSTGSGDKETSQGAVIGGAVGGAVGGLLLIAVIIAFFMIRSRREKRAKEAASQMEQRKRFAAGLIFSAEGKNYKSGLEPQITGGGYPAELGTNMELVELELSGRPVEMLAPPPLSEVSASPISTPGMSFAAHSDGGEVSPGFTYHQSLSLSMNSSRRWTEGVSQ